MNKKVRAVVLVVVVLVTGAALASTSESAPQEPPPGIPAHSWHSLAPNLGLYVHSKPTPTRSTAYPLAGTVTGTLMARIDGRWASIQLAVDDGPHPVPVR